MFWDTGTHKVYGILFNNANPNPITRLTLTLTLDVYNMGPVNFVLITHVP